MRSSSRRARQMQSRSLVMTMAAILVCSDERVGRPAGASIVGTTGRPRRLKFPPACVLAAAGAYVMTVDSRLDSRVVGLG